MTDEDKIAEYRAGHADRMKTAEDRVAENLRKYAEAEVRRGKRDALVARIEKFGGVVHDGNCCEVEYVELPEINAYGVSVNIEPCGMIYGDGSDPELLVLETIANLLEAYSS